jgi:hypothetical protein
MVIQEFVHFIAGNDHRVVIVDVVTNRALLDFFYLCICSEEGAAQRGGTQEKRSNGAAVCR